MAFKNLETSAEDYKKHTEEEFARYVELRVLSLIAEAMDRLNLIDSTMIFKEHEERARKIVKDYPVDWKSPENKEAEDKRQYLIDQFETITGKKLEKS